MAKNANSPFATAKEVANILNVSPSYVYNLLRKGALPGVRIGNCWRVDLRRLREYVSSNDVQTQAVRQRLTEEATMDADRSQLPTPQAEHEQGYDSVLEENRRLKEIVVKQRTQIEHLRNQLKEIGFEFDKA